MQCKNEERIQLGCQDQRKVVKPGVLQRTLNLFKQDLAFASQGSITVSGYENTRVLEAYQVEVERQRAVALMYYNRLIVQ